MGDVLHALPAVAGLRRTLPHCRIGWAVEPNWAPLLTQGCSGPLVDRVHLVPTKAWRQSPLARQTGAEILSLRRELREQRYDVCVDLQGTIKSALVGRLAGATRFLGPEHARERIAARLYDTRVATPAAHVIARAAQLLGAAAGQAIVPGRVQLPTDVEAEGWCSAALARQGITDRFVLLAPGAGWGAKQWGHERFAELAARMNASGFPVLVNASSDADSGLAESVAGSSGSVLRSTVPQLVALARRARLVVGGDSGPVHLAAALGRPVVALFGPTDPARNGPCFAGARVAVLRDPASFTSHKRRTATDPGLENLTVDQVEAACRELLGSYDG